MAYSIYVDASRKNRFGEYQVYIEFRDGAHKFRVGTGLYSSMKFKGREFPSAVSNARVKTNTLNKVIIAIDDYLISHRGDTFFQMKNALTTIVSGKHVAEKNICWLCGHVSWYKNE